MAPSPVGIGLDRFAGIFLGNGILLEFPLLPIAPCLRNQIPEIDVDSRHLGERLVVLRVELQDFEKLV